MTIVNKSEYKGHPMLELKWSEVDQYPFRFGLGKAKLLLACLDEIEEFVAENDKDK